jgi:hypothetical protein
MDRDLLVSYVEQGLSIYTIGKKFNKAPTTIKYWLNKYNLKTKNKSFKDGYHGKGKGVNDYFCTTCKIPITKQTGYIRKNRNGFAPECKNCTSNKSKLKRKNNKERAIEYKGGCCSRCGYDKNIASLEFHHLDPSQKEITPSKLTNREWKVLKEEIDKCTLLCSNCHREEHKRIDDKIQLKNDFKPFELNNFSNVILTGKNTGKTSCYICDIIVTEENLASKKHTPLCKPCNSKRIVNIAKNGKKRTVEYMGGCCSMCGYNKCIGALEFHHLDPSKKSKDYNRKFKLWNFERQKKELENCIIVCSNCHREIHNQ